MKISATGIWIKFKGTSCNKYAAIAIICVHVLIFPSWFAATTSPVPASTRRKPVTANSRLIITITIQAGTYCISTNVISAAETSNLSANGSRNFPKFVTRLYFLA